MMDYIRWMFGLEFCTPMYRYVIARKLTMDKLKIGWGIRARKYEEKIRKGDEVKGYWKKKEEYKWKDEYGREREKYYNGWGIEAKEVREGEENLKVEIINKKRDFQRQWEDSKIAKVRYNRRYKELKLEGRGPRYLKKENIENLSKGEVKALIKLRSGNWEQKNKYWLDEKY